MLSRLYNQHLNVLKTWKGKR